MRRLSDSTARIELFHMQFSPSTVAHRFPNPGFMPDYLHCNFNKSTRHRSIAKYQACVESLGVRRPAGRGIRKMGDILITCNAKRFCRSRRAWLSVAISLGMLVAGAAGAEQTSGTAANAADPSAVSGDKAGE